GCHQYIGELVDRSDWLMLADTRILQDGIVLHRWMQKILHRALDGFVHFRQRSILRNITRIPRILVVLRVGFVIVRREKSPNALRIHVERTLSVRCVGAVRKRRDVRDVISGPPLRCLVPPHDRLRAWIRLAMPVARSTVVENPHIVWPCPRESRVNAKSTW